jgi:dihydroflavonol-4-reductase
MNTILLTGATSFLGYHVVKRLNALGLRPRVLEPQGGPLAALDRLEVERCPGTLDEPSAVRAACAGVHTLLHLAFKVTVANDPESLAEMQRVNVARTRHLLQTAASHGVRRAVVTGSALAIGVSRQPAPLRESASWPQHAFDLAYAKIRREAELDALSQATSDFSVISVCPAFTFGPDDPTGAPANKLLQSLVSGKLRITLPVGVGCLDVRDFAQGMILAAERGRSGERYLLSGENVTASQLLEQAAAIAGVRAPRLRPPAFVLHGAVGALELVYRVRRKPAPITRQALQVLGRYAWYNTSKARSELGWTSRPLRRTLEDTIAWLRNPAAVGDDVPARAGGAAV